MLNYDDITPQRRDELLSKVVDIIAKYGLYTPAIFFITMGKPLAFLGSQAMFFAAPVAGVFVNEEMIEEYAHIMSDRENVERLLTMIEEREQESKPKKK